MAKGEKTNRNVYAMWGKERNKKNKKNKKKERTEPDHANMGEWRFIYLFK